MNPAEQGKFAAYIADAFRDDPFGYCKAILNYEPDPWQKDVMESVRDHPLTAVRSGNGPGKTRLDASVIHWFMATRSFPLIQATAGRWSQLKSRLWRELAKVNATAANAFMFEWTSTTFYLKDSPELWVAYAIPWSKSNPDSFAGAHEKNVLTLFDEASAIDDIIYEVANGAMTTPGARWLCTGNPTRNKGKFAECFGKGAWRDGDDKQFGWHGFTVSSFDSPRVSKQWIDQVIREYGEKSDYYRVHVQGLPPLQEEMQFISEGLFDSSVGRPPVKITGAVRILGVDPGAGGDRTAAVSRKGLEMRKVFARREKDTMATVGEIIAEFNRAKEVLDPYTWIVVDKPGIGWGVHDRLKELGFPVIGVMTGTEPKNPQKYRNLKAELWDGYKDWLREGSIDEEFAEELKEDSCGIEHSYDSAGRLVMEKKEHMKERGLASPDLGDAAVLTFYPPSNLASAPRPASPQRRNDPDDWRSLVGM